MQEAGQLDLPKDYSAANALRGAWLMLQDIQVNGRPVLEVCTKESVSFALLKMVLDGLTPLKNQGAFVPRGNTLTWVREYAGNLAIAKRTAGVIDANATIIWEGDDFIYDMSSIGVPRILRHDQKFENVGGKMLGAYAVIRRSILTDYVEIMTIDQIKQAWAMNRSVNKAHTQFPDQMAKKTVLNRALKLLINSTSDEALFEQEPQTHDLPMLDHITTQVAQDLAEETLGHQLEETPIFEQMENDPEW